VDNLWITIAFHNAEWISWAVLERERGGWCIIGVLENEIDLHLTNRNQGGYESATSNASNPHQNRLQQAFVAFPHLPLRNHANRF
jgi:hypothetical protein